MSDLLFNYTKRKASLFVIFLLLYETSTYIANDMIMPGMLQVVHSFSAPDSMVAASLTAFIFGGASLQLFLGPISDRFGRRPVMIFGAVFFLLCTIFIALSQSINEFILARFLQGMGLCFISVVGYATLQEIFAETYAVRIISLMSNITILAPLLGPVLGSLVIEAFSWRVIFHIIAVAAAIALIGLWLYTPETIGQQKLDGTHHSATPLQFRVVMKNYKKLFMNARFMYGSIALGVAIGPMIAWIGVSPLILIKAAHLRPIYYGFWQIPIFFMSIVGNMAMRHYLQKQTKSLLELAKIGTHIVWVSLIAMSIVTYFNPHYILIVLGLCIYTLGCGFIAAPLTRLTLFSTSIPKGTASALLSIIQMIIIGLCNQIAGWVYFNHNNFYFSSFCALCGLTYLGCYYLMLRSKAEAA